MRTYVVTVIVKAENKDKAVEAAISYLNAGGDPDEITHEPDAAEYGEQGSALTPVIAILTAFTVAAVLIAQSGLLHLVIARLAAIR